MVGQAGVRRRLDRDVVDVHVPRAGDDERDQLGDVLGAKRVESAVDLGGPLGVAVEADE